LFPKDDLIEYIPLGISNLGTAMAMRDNKTGIMFSSKLHDDNMGMNYQDTYRYNCFLRCLFHQ